MYQHVRCILFISILSSLIIGCASTTIYPKSDGSYSLVTTSAEQGYAEKDALKKASEHCASFGKRLAVVQHKTAYHGANKDNAALIGLASAVLMNGPNPAKSSQDYEVTMVFKCQ